MHRCAEMMKTFSSFGALGLIAKISGHPRTGFRLSKAFLVFEILVGVVPVERVSAHPVRPEVAMDSPVACDRSRGPHSTVCARLHPFAA